MGQASSCWGTGTNPHILLKSKSSKLSLRWQANTHFCHRRNRSKISEYQVQKGIRNPLSLKEGKETKFHCCRRKDKSKIPQPWGKFRKLFGFRILYPYQTEVGYPGRGGGNFQPTPTTDTMTGLLSSEGRQECSESPTPEPQAHRPKTGWTRSPENLMFLSPALSTKQQQSTTGRDKSDSKQP